MILLNLTVALTLTERKEEVSAVCDKEEFNTLNINLLHEISIGKSTVEEARRFATETAYNFIHNKVSSTYLEGFIFQPQYNTADPDIQIF